MEKFVKSLKKKPIYYRDKISSFDIEDEGTYKIIKVLILTRSMGTIRYS